MAHKGEKENGSHYSSSGGATKNVYSKKKRTSFVNDNKWWRRLKEGFENLKRGGPYNPQEIIRSMEKREGLSNLPSYTMPKADPRKFEFSKEELSGNAMKMAKMREGKQGHFVDAMQDPWNARKKQKSDNASRY